MADVKFSGRDPLPIEVNSYLCDVEFFTKLKVTIRKIGIARLLGSFAGEIGENRLQLDQAQL